MKRLPPLVAVVLAAGAAGASAQAPPPPPTGPGTGTGTGPSPRQLRVTELLNRAIDRTYDARPGCRPANPFDRRTTFTDDAPRQETLDAFAILRRPGTPAELAAAGEVSRLPADGVYRNHVRFARSAGGRRLTVVVARDVGFHEPRGAGCVAELRRQGRRVLRRAHEDGRTRRAFRRGLEQVIRDEWAAAAVPDEDGFFLFSGASMGGGSVLSDVTRRGLLLGTGGSLRRAARFDGLIPDGVARVRATFRGGAVRTVAVRENVVSFRVRTPEAFPFPRRIAWLAADGSRVRVVRFP